MTGNLVLQSKTKTKAKKGGRKMDTRNLDRRIRKEARKLMEKKYFANEFTGTANNAYNVAHQIDAVPQGNSKVSRTGDKIMPTSIKFGYILRPGDSTNVFRVLLVQWLDDSSNYTPVAQDIVNDAINSDYNILSSYHQHTKKTFKILYDKTHVVTTSGANNGVAVTGKVIPGSLIQNIGYNAAATKGYGNIYLFFVSDSGGTPNPSIAWYSNIRFTDA